MASKELPRLQHLVIPPSSPHAEGEDCLLAIAPGALLPPTAFSSLAAAVQAAAPQLRLWCAVIDNDLMQLIPHFGIEGGNLLALLQAMDASGGYPQLLQQLLDQATAEGFKPRRDSGARVGNMAVLCQSAGGIGFAPLSATAAGATILLASAPNPLEQYPHHQVVSMEAWPRPLLMLVGELDGQMRWPWLSSYLAESAVMAAKFGPGYTAAHKPVVVVPGVNHGNTSTGEARTARGDIVTGVADYDTCVKTLATHLAAFLVAHFATADDARAEASTALLQAVRQTMLLTAPYCVALGLGDTAAPYGVGAGANGSASNGTAEGGAFLPGGLVLGAQRSAGLAASNALPPGVVAVAEGWAVELQRRVLAGLPAQALERVTIAATAHTNVESLLYTQPEMTPLGDGKYLLRVHTHIHLRSLDGMQAVPMQHLTSKAPDYTLKLKEAGFVAAVLGLPNPSQYTNPTPAELNAMALERALAATPPQVAERYRQLGRQMEFGDDVDVFVPGPDGKLPPSPEAFIRDARISFKHQAAPASTVTSTTTDPSASAPQPTTAPTPSWAAPGGGSSGGVVRVSSPYLLMPVPEDFASRPAPMRRFMGPYYVKVISVAQAMEWVALDCLRGIDTPW